MQNLEEKNESEFMTLATRAAEYQRPSIDPTHAPTAQHPQQKEGKVISCPNGTQCI